MRLVLNRIPQLASLVLGLAFLPLALNAQEAPEVLPFQVEVIPMATPGVAPSIGRINRPDQVPESFWAHGTVGDIILNNGVATAVFGNPDAGDPIPQNARRGNLIDLFSSPAVEENFQLFLPILNTEQGQSIVVQNVDILNYEEEEYVELFAAGTDVLLEGLAVDTLYTMKRGWPGVLAETTVTNDSGSAITVPVLADYISWGGMPAYVPGFGIVTRQVAQHPAEFVFGQLYDSVIMIAPKDGMFEVDSTALATTLIYDRNVVLQPGQTRTYSRWLLTRQHDPGALFSFVQEQRGLGTYGYLVGKIIERNQLADGRIVDAGDVGHADVRIDVIRRPELPRVYVDRRYIITRTDANGRFQVALPPGEYLVKDAHFAHSFVPVNIASRVVANGITPLDHGVSPPSGVTYEIIDADSGAPIPGKLSFIPLRGASSSGFSFGDPGAEEAFNVVYTPTGRGTVKIAPGAYRVVASLGNEYHSEEQRIQVSAMKYENVRFQLRRAFTSDGYISADLGVLTEKSAQSRTTPRARVISAVAEGLDWIVTADPGKPTDLSAVIKELNLQDRIRSSMGYRVIPSIENNIGDYLLFPVEVADEELLAKTETVESATTPDEAQAALRKLQGDAIILANRLLDPNFGLLALSGFDFSTGTFPSPVIPMNVDAIQIWEGKSIPAVAIVRPIHTVLAAKNYRPTPIASSLSRGTFNREPGYPRVYIPSSKNRPADFDLIELADHVRAGNVQITNGPFIRMRVNGKDASEVATLQDSTLRVELEVYTPNWANISAINVMYNESIVRRFVLPPGAYDANSGKAFPIREGEGSFSVLPPLEDGVLRIVVEGDPSLTQEPVNPHFVASFSQNQTPTAQTTLAISETFYVDRDGDGKVDIPFTLQRLAPDDSEFVPDF